MKNLLLFLQALTAFVKVKVFIVPAYLDTIGLTIYKSGEGSPIEHLLNNEELRKGNILYDTKAGDVVFVIRRDLANQMDEDTQAINCLMQLFLAIDDKVATWDKMSDDEQFNCNLINMGRTSEIVGADNAIKAITAGVKHESVGFFNESFTEENFANVVKESITAPEPTPEQQQFNIGILAAVYRGRVAACNQQ